MREINALCEKRAAPPAGELEAMRVALYLGVTSCYATLVMGTARH